MAEEKKTTPLKAIRAHCLDCSNGQWKEVKLCPCTDCNLWEFRFGKNPYLHGPNNPGGFMKDRGKTDTEMDDCELDEEELDYDDAEED